jgi:hypothetical protein
VTSEAGYHLRSTVLGPAGSPNVPPIGAGHFGAQYDVSPDGRRVYFFDRTPEPPATEFHLVQDWAALLR